MKPKSGYELDEALFELNWQMQHTVSFLEKWGNQKKDSSRHGRQKSDRSPTCSYFLNHYLYPIESSQVFVKEEANKHEDIKVGLDQGGIEEIILGADEGDPLEDDEHKVEEVFEETMEDSSTFVLEEVQGCTLENEIPIESHTYIWKDNVLFEEHDVISSIHELLCFYQIIILEKYNDRLDLDLRIKSQQPREYDAGASPSFFHDPKMTQLFIDVQILLLKILDDNVHLEDPDQIMENDHGPWRDFG